MNELSSSFIGHCIIALLLFILVNADLRPLPQRNASFIMTKENRDYVYNKVIRDYPIVTKGRNYPGRLLLGPNRLEIPEFLNTSEVESMEKLFEVFNNDFITIGTGYKMFGLKNEIPETSFASIRTSQSMTHMQKLFPHQKPHRLHLFKFWLSVVDKITEAAESFFETQLATDNIFIAYRTSDMKSKMEFPGCNISRWSHEPHIDQCTLVVDQDHGVRCQVRKVGFPIEYSAVLYLNKLEEGGGELVFLDLIQGKEGLVHSSTRASTSHVKGSVNSTKSKDGTQNGAPGQSIRSYNEYLKPIKYETVVSPGYGKLVLFTTSPENAHGIKEIREGTGERHTMVIFFVRKALVNSWIKY